MNLPTFSIIVPVYNVASYLPRCIDSILSQNYANFEVILVNDGSTDSSGEICNNYAAKDNRIKVSHKKNGGLSSARNGGLEIAKYEWIAFVDSDDWIEKEYLNVISQKILLLNADLYSFGYQKTDGNNILYDYVPQYIVENSTDFIKSNHYKYSHTAWAYILRKSILDEHNIKFPAEIKQYTEDQPFLLKYISKCNKVGLINKILYNYYLNHDSITKQQVNIDWVISKIQAVNDFLQFCNQNNVAVIFFEQPIEQLYEDFFLYGQMMQNPNSKNLQELYRKEYRKTLQLYPSFGRFRVYKLASYDLSLHAKYPKFKKHLFNTIRKGKNMLKLFQIIKQVLYNSLHIEQTVSQIVQQENNVTLRKIMSAMTIDEYNRLARECKSIGITNEKYYKQDVIVSLTSYGRRIHEVYLTIESIMRQTAKPNKIILWLAEDEFTMDTIPISLKRLIDRGLTIEFCEDIKSYKKLVPALRKYPNDIIITVDDDIIYQEDMIENLLGSYHKNPDVIHFCRGHRMKMGKDGSLNEYNQWDFFVKDLFIDKLNFPTGAGSILYPPYCLHEDVIDEKLFMTLCPTADDVWFKAMALLKGTYAKKVYTKNANGEDYTEIKNEAQTETALWNINMTRNDEQIKSVFSRYNIYKLLE